MRDAPRPEFEGGFFRRAVGVFNDVNFSGARANHHASVLPKHHGADFHAKMIRRQGVYLVVFGFARRDGQSKADQQNCEVSFQSLHSFHQSSSFLNLSRCNASITAISKSLSGSRFAPDSFF